MVLCCGLTNDLGLGVFSRSSRNQEKKTAAQNSYLGRSYASFSPRELLIPNRGSIGISVTGACMLAGAIERCITRCRKCSMYSTASVSILYWLHNSYAASVRNIYWENNTFAWFAFNMYCGTFAWFACPLNMYYASLRLNIH